MVTRRTFLAAGAALLAGCGQRKKPATQPAAGSSPTAMPATGPATAPAAKVIDAGAVADYAKPGVYSSFSETGFFVIRRDRRVFALSSTCTHKACTVDAQEDGSFFCHCHKSRFDAAGHVTKGPAKRDLPRLAVKVDERQHLLVDMGQAVANETVPVTRPA